MSVPVSPTAPAGAASLLTPADVAVIHDLQLDGLATAIALGGFALVLYRTDEGTGDTTALAPATVARRWANRQAGGRVSEAARADYVGGQLRAFAPWNVAPGDAFVLAEGPGRIVAPVTTKDGITTADFELDQGGA